VADLRLGRATAGQHFLISVTKVLS
jgi:hypothetical protein